MSPVHSGSDRSTACTLGPGLQTARVRVGKGLQCGNDERGRAVAHRLARRTETLSRRSGPGRWGSHRGVRRAEPLNACGVGDEEREQRSNQRHDHQVCAGQLLSHPHAATRRAHSTVIDTHAQGHNPITVQWVVVVAIAHGTYSYSGRHRCGERSSAMPCAILDTSREG